jgi:hypothetical protein
MLDDLEFFEKIIKIHICTQHWTSLKTPNCKSLLTKIVFNIFLNFVTLNVKNVDSILMNLKLL